MSVKMSKPQFSDAKFMDIAMNLYIYPTVLVAHHLGFFEMIAHRICKLEDIMREMALEKRPVEGVMATLQAMGIIDGGEKGYHLLPDAKEYLLKNSPSYIGSFLDILYENSENYSVKKLEEAIKSNTAQIYNTQELFETNVSDRDKARAFTRSMHSISIGSASVWPEKLSLAGHRIALDVGGGSGAHAIGMASCWPQLQCIIFDLPQICRISQEYITRYGLSERISTYDGDMWRDDYPEADLHFYSSILHDWPTEKGQYLLEKSYAHLPAGGRIIIHEMLYHDDAPGPLAVAGYSLMMLGWTQGKQYTGQQLKEMLLKAGFDNVDVFASHGYHSIVTAVK